MEVSEWVTGIQMVLFPNRESVISVVVKCLLLAFGQQCTVPYWP